MKYKILVTGAAGFIGFHLTQRLLQSGFKVVGLDNLNEYYDIKLKYDRLLMLGITPKFSVLVDSICLVDYQFIQYDLTESDQILEFMTQQKFDFVVNLAAQAGVRYSIENPRTYVHNNVDAFLTILEGCRHTGVKHLIYASTSSVYGMNESMPLSESQNTDRPLAIYAATKKANELMAHSYSHLFGLRTTGLRFFTVYGPWGRPDMALFLFTQAIMKGEPINLYNNGEMIRDFTYIDDVVESINKLMYTDLVLNDDGIPYEIYNVGNSRPTPILYYLKCIESRLNKKAKIKFCDMQDGDVKMTHADTEKLAHRINFKPHTSVEFGVSKFVDWYCEYTKISS